MEMSDPKLEGSVKCDWKSTIKRKIPITEWLPEYSTNFLFHDLLAGFTVALTEIPQCIAYAGIAGLPLQYGLYSSFMGGFVYAIFGSCRAINMGSTSIMALLIQSYVRDLGVAASIFMSLVGGMIILVFGLLNLGFVIDFFSYPVMSGFTSAAALTIASSQIKNFLGIAGQAVGFLQSWQDVCKNVGEISRWDTVLSSLSLLVLFALKELGNLSEDGNTCIKRLVFFVSVAKNAIVVTSGILLAYYLESKNLKYLKLTGSVHGGFPHFELPSFDFNIFGKFGVSLVFIPVVAILETVAIGKVFYKGKSLDGSQEMVALGMANIMGSLVQSMPVTGSFTRTAVNNASGAKSNMAAVFTGSFILVSLPFLTSIFYYIPKSTLAAVIICAMFYLFDFNGFVTLWRSNKLELIPFLVTLFSCLFLSLDYGILIGIATHLTFLLHSSARPSIKFQQVLHNPDVYLFAPKSNIRFPAVNYVRNIILKCEKPNSLIIFDGKRVDHMDVTVAKSIGTLVTEVRMKNQRIVFLNFERHVKALCINLDRNLKKYFKNGAIEDVIQEPSSRLEAFSIQL